MRLDFLRDRLNREARATVGIELSKRQYNRRFRVTQRLSAKAERVAVEQTKRQLAIVARAGFAASIDRSVFLADPWAGCFVAYLTAKRKLRREFTLAGRDNPYDDIADLLFQEQCALGAVAVLPGRGQGSDRDQQPEGAGDDEPLPAVDPLSVRTTPAASSAS
jgi:hypothetical protein